MREINKDNLFWYDLDLASTQDIDFLSSKLTLTPEAKKIILEQAHFQKIQKETDYSIVILHYPLFDKTKRRNYPIEIDFIITENILFTLHSKPIHFLDDMFEEFQNNQIPASIKNSLDLYTTLIHKIISACIRPLDHMAANIENIEEHIFENRQNQIIHEIAVVKQDILDFRKIIRLQKSTIDASFKLLSDPQIPLQPEKSTFMDIINTNVYIWQTLENLLETIEALEDLNQTIISHKLNTNIKTLTIFATLMAPGTLIVGFFGMNVAMPFLNNVWAFPSITIGVLLISCLILLFFKSKNVI
jgi:magnesium transporter